jgi:hypothetical protein
MPTWNGLMCTGDRFGIIEFESIAPDFNTRMISPVYVATENHAPGKWINNSLNMWKEWDWLGREPMNDRMQRYYGLYLVWDWYNITFSSQNPTDMRFRLQDRLP